MARAFFVLACYCALYLTVSAFASTVSCASSTCEENGVEDHSTLMQTRGAFHITESCSSDIAALKAELARTQIQAKEQAADLQARVEELRAELAGQRNSEKADDQAIKGSNKVIEHGAGGYGGSCTCPDGQLYWVGDENNNCGSLACVGGVSGKCNRRGGKWSGRKVICEAATAEQQAVCSWSSATVIKGRRCSIEMWNIKGSRLEAQAKCESDPSCLGLMLYSGNIGDDDDVRKVASGWYQGCGGQAGSKHNGGWDTIMKPKTCEAKKSTMGSGEHQEAGNQAELPEAPPEGGCCQGLCMLYGDPHFMSFDGYYTIQNKGTRDKLLWAVHSQVAKIQLYSPTHRNTLAAFAVTGDIIGQNTLVGFRPSRNSPDYKVLWNGKQILQNNGDFANPYPGVRLSRNKGLGKDLGAGLAAIKEYYGTTSKAKNGKGKNDAEWVKGYLTRFENHVNFEFKLPSNIEIHVAGTDSLSVILKMPPVPGAGSAASFLEGVEGGQASRQSGFCGNFNGDPSDDDDVPNLGPVEESDDVFKAAGISLSELSSQMDYGEEDGTHGSSGDCTGSIRDKAVKACEDHPSIKEKESCIADICASDDVGRAVGALDSLDMLTLFHGKGIPIFEGHGNCLDAAGNSFSKIKANAVKSIQGCAHLLRKLTHFSAVRGAEMTTGSACSILLEPGFKDIQKQEIPGGWGAFSDGQGQGVVGSSSLEKNSYCWKVF